MRTFALLTAVGLALGLAGAALAQEKESRKEQFDKIKEEFRERQIKAFKAGMKINTTAYAQQILKLVEEDPKDDLSYDMLSYSLKTLKTSNPVLLKALVDFHLDNEKNGSLCLALSRSPADGTTKFVDAVYNKHPDKDTKGLALYSLAQMSNTLLDASEEPEAKLKEKTLALWRKVIAEVGDQAVGKTTLGREAKNHLFVIENLSIGCTAPDTVTQDLEGNKVKLSDYRGKVVALDIWATWCGPCLAMIPHEREMVERLKDKPFALISLSGDAKKETLEKFLEKTKMPWTHWWSGNQEGFIRDWKVSFYPTIYILDAKGVIRYKGVRGEKMEEAVHKLLKETK